MDEKINGIRKLLEDKDMDKEVKCYLESQLESLERDKKIINNYNNTIDEVYNLINNISIENKILFSNELITLVEYIKNIDSKEFLNFILDIQNIFKSINKEDSKEIMSHVYTRFFTEHIKKINK